MAGSHPFPRNGAAWEAWIRSQLAEAGRAEAVFRLVKFDGPCAIVEFDQFEAPRLRARWGPSGTESSRSIRTHRTWGTLVGAKRWLKSRPGPGR